MEGNDREELTPARVEPGGGYKRSRSEAFVKLIATLRDRNQLVDDAIDDILGDAHRRRAERLSVGCPD